LFCLRLLCHETLTIFNDANRIDVVPSCTENVVGRTPDRPICEINIWQYPKDTRTRPYTPQEIQDMRDFLKKHGMTYQFPSSSSSSAAD
jgi:hypothetical protein